ncbi:glycosyltransferase [uncultured Methanospirillum sp.]|uniref:glycosyltransferase n=1 Tax=uncultured Methanospirillum sp. TaxID=262503 RepID=UPI0029C730C5|nr:glycosyltransferase [uncultured Methanospirillum sp.]
MFTTNHNNIISICVVADELRDIAPSGGLGTATHFLAQILQKNKFQVKILYTNPHNKEEEEIKEIKRHYLNTYNLDIEFLSTDTYSNYYPNYLQRSKAVYDFFTLSKLSYDIILFHDIWHDGYLCLKCKTSTQRFNNTLMGIICHGSFQWVQESHGVYIGDNLIFHSELERHCMAMADFVVSPSQYMVDWMIKKGWNLPSSIHIIPYPIEPELGWQSEESIPSNNTPEFAEIVFFGRIELRKGVYIFIDALRLIPYHILSGKIITFLGLEIIPRSELLEKLDQMKLPVKEYRWIHLNSEGARKYLQESGKIAIMPSPADNSPCVIYECLIDKIPFLCSNNGGQPELINPNGHNKCLFDPNPEKLAEKVIEVLKCKSYSIPKPSLNVKQASSEIINLFSELGNYSKRKHNTKFTFDKPIVSVIIMMDNNNDGCDTLSSVLYQTYSNFEIDIIGHSDNNYTKKFMEIVKNESSKRKINIHSTKKSSLNSFRNSLILQNNRENIIFMDNNVTLLPDFIETSINIMHNSNSDCVIATKEIISEDIPSYWIPIGGGSEKDFIASSVYENMYGDRCMMVKRSVYIINPIRDPYIVGISEWSFLMDLHLSKYRISIYPNPLYSSKSGQMNLTPKTPREYNIIKDTLEKHKKIDVALLGEIILFRETRNISRIFNVSPDIERKLNSLSYLIKRLHLQKICEYLIHLISRFSKT